MYSFTTRDLTPIINLSRGKTANVNETMVTHFYLFGCSDGNSSITSRLMQFLLTRNTPGEAFGKKSGPCDKTKYRVVI